jgi:hypothetical protein
MNSIVIRYLLSPRAAPPVPGNASTKFATHVKS